MGDQFDVEVHDSDALAEIELLANLIVATSEHEGRLSQERIDEILGVSSSSSEVQSGTRDDPIEPDEPGG